MPSPTVLLALLGAVVVRLAGAGRFTAENWGPVLFPSDENFDALWNVLGAGMRHTLVAAIGLTAYNSVIIAELVRAGVESLPPVKR
ncbi:hypothetical protein [Streptomyces brasiliscabiei]|uniref:hypothetical protein n=1 Tax=Streptomyces brasiliscabiei TaxID=2736302 RepID=UPI001C1198B3|nr:hypothetical protein [Streptomyces brasiliscabiei]